MTIPKFARISARVACGVEINACTVLNSRPARIVDLSPHGAQVRLEQPYEVGQQIYLDYDGDIVWGVVAWAEVDRMGVKFKGAIDGNHRLSRVIANAQRVAALTNQRPQTVGFGRRVAA